MTISPAHQNRTRSWTPDKGPVLRLSWITPGVVSAAVLAACSGSGTVQQSTVAEYDSAGVRIIDNGVLEPVEEAQAPPTPTVQIGVVEGQDAYQLFRVSDVKRLSDGAIAVANGGTRELRIYEADGTHRATAGGAGEGPGEFRYPRALVVLPGDTIQVQDFLDRVYFTADGAFVRRQTTDRGAFAALWQGAGNMAEGGIWTADGKLFSPVSRSTASPPTTGPLFRPQMTLVRVSPDLTTADTLGVFGGILQQYLDVGEQRVWPIVPPFAPYASWAVGSSDGTVAVGDNARPRIERFHADGTRTIVRWAAEPDPISGAEVEGWKDRQRNAEWTQGQLPRLERGWAAMDIPSTKPFYGRVTAGSDGTLWITPVEGLEDGSPMMRFTPEGHYAGAFDFPERFVVHDSGPGWVLGVMRDESDVEFVQLYTLKAQRT